MTVLDEIKTDLADLKTMFSNFLNGKYQIPKPDRRLSMLEVAEVIGWFFGVSIEDMKSDCRDGHIMKARHMARYIMLTEFHYTVPQVSDFIKCTRATTYNTIYRTQNWLSTDRNFKKLYQFCMEEIARKSKDTYNVDNKNTDVIQQPAQ